MEPRIVLITGDFANGKTFVSNGLHSNYRKIGFAVEKVECIDLADVAKTMKIAADRDDLDFIIIESPISKNKIVGLKEKPWQHIHIDRYDA